MRQTEPLALYTSVDKHLSERFFTCPCCLHPVDGSHQCGGCFRHVHVYCARVHHGSSEGLGQMLCCGLCNETNKEETATQLWPQDDTEVAYQDNATGNLDPEAKAREASTKVRRVKRKHNDAKRFSTGSQKKAKLARTRNVAGNRTGSERTSAGNGAAAGKEIDTSTSKEWPDSESHMLNDDASNNQSNGDTWDEADYYWDDAYGTWVYIGHKRARRKDLTNKKEKNWALGMRRNWETEKYATMMKSITITRDKLDTVRMRYVAITNHTSYAPSFTNVYPLRPIIGVP